VQASRDPAQSLRNPGSEGRPKLVSAGNQPTDYVGLPSPSQEALRYYYSGCPVARQHGLGNCDSMPVSVHRVSAGIRTWAQRVGRKWFLTVGFYFAILSRMRREVAALCHVSCVECKSLAATRCWECVMDTENKKEEITVEEPSQVTCPRCSSRRVRVVSRKDNYRPRSQTGNLRTDLTPISTTVTYKCQDQTCGQEWSETSPL
jgi:hypothetical protein